jgi:hypothetical protein
MPRTNIDATDFDAVVAALDEVIANARASFVPAMIEVTSVRSYDGQCGIHLWDARALRKFQYGADTAEASVALHVAEPLIEDTPVRVKVQWTGELYRQGSVSHFKHESSFELSSEQCTHLDLSETLKSLINLSEAIIRTRHA